MGFETNKIFDYLYKKFTREGYRSTFPDLFQTFSSCSIDQTHCLPLVASTIRSINFDLLTRRLYRQQGNIPQSADAMSFAKDDVFLIEFKSGDQVEKNLNKKKLIRRVTGKINDSNRTLYTCIFPNIASLNEDKVKSRFYLVVDAEAMGIDILLQELIFRSKSSLPTGDEKIDALIGEVLPNLKDGVDNPEHYKEIDIWFSELFDTYLSSYGIQDIRRMVE